MLMTYLMSYVLYLIHLMYFSLMLGRVMLTCDSFALVGWTSTPKGGFTCENPLFTRCFSCAVTVSVREDVFITDDMPSTGANV